MNYIIKKICQEKLITDFLTKRGIFPDGPEVNGKLKYRCPIHANDNTPSFYVYLNSGDFQNYFCFGCKSNYSIIHLYKALNNISIKEAVKQLSDGMDFNINSEMDHIISDLNADQNFMRGSAINLSLQINSMLRCFLNNVEYEKSCVDISDKISKIVDECLDKCDIENLESLINTIPEQIARKTSIVLLNKENEEKENLKKKLLNNTDSIKLSSGWNL